MRRSATSFPVRSRARFSFTPRVESLETIQLLSTLPGRPSIGPPLQIVNRPPTAPLKLMGTVQGRYLIQSDAYAGSILRLQGAGSVVGMGQARLSGELPANHPQDTMEVTLTGRRGALTLRLAASMGSLSSSASAGRGQRVAYAVVGGTGIYASATGQGTADLILQPQTRSFGTSGRLAIRFLP